jgi:preprotein translocase subunit SecD
MKPQTPAPQITALILCLVALLAYGVNSACAPAVGESDDRDQGLSRKPVHFELRLASDQPVDGWKRQTIAGSQYQIYLAPDVQITNADIARAWFQPRGEQYAVGLYFTEEGALKLASFTGKNIGKKAAMIVDGRVLSAPRIMAQISDRAEIHGDFTEQEARDLAAALDPGEKSPEEEQQSR